MPTTAIMATAAIMATSVVIKGATVGSVGSDRSDAGIALTILPCSGE